MFPVARFLGFALLASYLVLPLRCQAQEEKLLRWALRAGDELSVSVTQTSNQLMYVANRSIRTSTEMKMFVDWSVNNVDEDGTSNVTQTITRLTMEMDITGGDSIRYDSASDESPTGALKKVADSVEPLIGARMDVTMSARGEIVDVDQSQLKSEVLKSPLLSKEGLPEILGQAAIVFPEKALTPGDSWNSTTTISSPLGSLRQDRNYTYEGTEQLDDRPVEKIVVDADLQLDQSKLKGVKLELVEQQQSGTVLFDAESGRIVRSSVSQELTTETPYRDTTIRVTVSSSSLTNIEPASP